ncbi:MAG: hypothetical protein E6I46_07320 [Chloroflexi bacterium]|nr:MAG: hypothetical protein E6I46_07320 [Chloroflexota bacterium]
MPRVLITETVLRDAQQSLVQGRLKLQHVLPIAKNLDDIGYHALDAWGGWTFAASVRALQEDPWQRLRALRGAIEKTPLQMLIRGQTLIAQSHQPDDVVRAFIQQAVEDGIRVVRMFDPLNDLRNLEVPIEAAHQAGARVIGALVYSPSPVEDEAWLVRSANRLKALGADWIGIEDVAGGERARDRDQAPHQHPFPLNDSPGAHLLLRRDRSRRDRGGYGTLSARLGRLATGHRDDGRQPARRAV